MSTKDYFSGVAQNYHQFRPAYPRALFSYLASLVQERHCAWDCGTGNGQAARGLIPYFDKIIATDISTEQLSEAYQHDKITYLQASAEHSTLEDHSVDLITVAQALHWFDFALFFAETRRVLKKTGYLAAWTYPFITFVDPKINHIFQSFALRDLALFWPKERQYCDNRYRDIPFELNNLQSKEFVVTLSYSLAQLIGYVGTWSAVSLYQEKKHQDPIKSLLLPALVPLWSEPQQPKLARLEIILKFGQI